MSCLHVRRGSTLAAMNENKQLMLYVFSELSKGNGRPFVDHMADDFSWTIIGSTPWSRTYHGKQAVLSDLLTPAVLAVC